MVNVILTILCRLAGLSILRFANTDTPIYLQVIIAVEKRQWPPPRINFAPNPNFKFVFGARVQFDDDHAAGRHLPVVSLVGFQHSTALGNAPAHKLFELVKVDGVTKDKDGKKVFASSDSEFPRSLADYCGVAPDGDLHVKDGKVLSGKNGEGVAFVQAQQIVWEIPPTS